ncbi:T9SS type A sorting domain-containing protein [uncultured Psychroserpens sp.]|uniref:T9SS type A sorting domain-containing protein n=1 Tax=uncultured Psychroserpens sp. TaxID=255436 RepID=UPI0026148773|nr:T9SS type A sorting domain-containing protein [uncultured Psychroserpens sp.]
MKKITLLIFLLVTSFTFSQEDCAGVVDLSALTSPYNGDTTGAVNDFGQDCLTNADAPDQVFSILVPAGQQLVIGQSANGYDSKHRVAYGTCPGETLIDCTDDPDTQTITWNNDTGSDQTVFWTQSAFSTGSGTFTLEWVVQDPPSAPDNDDCVNAIAIACGDSVIGSTAAATDSEGNAAPDVFYSIAGTDNGEEVTVSLCGSSFDTVLNVFDACGGNVVATNDDSCSLQSELTFTSDGVTTYIVRVEGFGSNSGDYALAVSCVPPPECTPATIDSSTVVDSCNPDGTGTFTVDIVVSDAGDAGSVFDDGINPTEAVVAGTVTMGPYDSGDSVTIELTALDPACSSTVGTFEFTCPQPAPDNDDCVNATAIACGDSVTGSTASATDSEGNAAPDVFYSIAGTANGEEITVSLCGSSFDTVLNVFDACSGNVVATNDDSCSLQSELTFTSDGATTYTVRVEGFNTASGDYALTVSCLPPPACTPATIDSSTVVESCNPDGTGTFTVDIVVSDAGDAGSVFDDGINPTEAVVAGTVTMGPYNSGDSVTIELTALDPACSSTVDTFEFTCPLPGPENDDCIDAAAIACGDTVLGSTANATDSGGTASPDVFYSLSGTALDEVVTVSLCGSSFDTRLEVFDACDGNIVASNDDSCGLQSELTFASDGATTYIIRVEGFGSNSGDYELTISCEEPANPPENDDVAGAIDLPVGNTLCETTVLGTNVASTTSAENEGASCGTPEGDVWFKVMVPFTGELTIETSNSGDASSITDTVMAVYSGTSGALVEVGCDDDGAAGLFSQVALSGLTPGDVLLVRVWEFGDDTKGNFNICAWSPTSLGVEDDTFAGFNYYPNPVKDVLALDSPNRAIDKIEVFNVLGQRIIAIDSQNTIQNIDMSNLQSGAYIVKVSIESQTKAIRVLKE